METKKEYICPKISSLNMAYPDNVLASLSVDPRNAGNGDGNAEWGAKRWTMDDDDEE